jgi:hypothetical protein
MSWNGPALTAAAVGSVFVYGGLKGKSPLQVLVGIVQGQSPKQALASQGIGSSITVPTQGSGVDTTTPGGVGSASNLPTGGNVQQILKNAAAARGWDTGAQWQALNNIEMNEAGYQPTVKNSSSGALGIAQALGHGNSHTAGTLGNEYGGYGLSNAQAVAANSGDAAPQAVWMVNYIASRYGNPVNAWAQYHHADGSKWY